MFRRRQIVGKDAIVWRYDPVFLSEKYSLSFHKKAFRSMAVYLKGCTEQCVVSFIDLYEKTKRNFPQARTVSSAQQMELIDAFDSIAAENGMQIHLCCESSALTAGHPHTDAQVCPFLPTHWPERPAPVCLAETSGLTIPACMAVAIATQTTTEQLWRHRLQRTTPAPPISSGMR